MVSIVLIFYQLSLLELRLSLGPGLFLPLAADSIQCALSKDFLQHAKIADRLLGHYCQQWKTRECYWLARTRSQQVGDLLCMMVDSYDKAKCMLPKYPRGRTPKQVIYEQIKRASSGRSNLFYFICCTALFSRSMLSVWGSHILGTSLTLTCSLIHGYGVYIYLGDEGIPSGANWTIEVVLWLSLLFGLSV